MTVTADVLISCDTVVALDGVIFGKPGTVNNAIKMLKQLRGRTHEVISGVYLIVDGKEYLYSVVSSVTLKNLSDGEILNYVEEYLPLDKAGSYGIQDGFVVESYEGDYENIVGLPMKYIRKIFRELGYAQR